MKTVLTPGKMTIFPQGAIHTMMNRGKLNGINPSPPDACIVLIQSTHAYSPLSPGCSNAQLVSALSDEDSGTSNLLNGLFQLPEDFVAAAFGNTGLNVNKTASALPPIAHNGAAGSLECMQRCGMNVTQYL